MARVVNSLLVAPGILGALISKATMVSFRLLDLFLNQGPKDFPMLSFHLISLRKDGSFYFVPARLRRPTMETKSRGNKGNRKIGYIWTNCARMEK